MLFHDIDSNSRWKNFCLGENIYQKEEKVLQAQKKIIVQAWIKCICKYQQGDYKGSLL